LEYLPYLVIAVTVVLIWKPQSLKINQNRV
jgi:hypothetical protein